MSTSPPTDTVSETVRDFDVALLITFRTLIEPVGVVILAAFRSPATSNLAVGVVVPIPTSPIRCD